MKASVCILTFNGQEYIEEVLNAVFQQKLDADYEVIVIDSGSTDTTLSTVKQFPVTLRKIPNGSFQHGRTRNMAIEMAQGEYVVFLVQDATPAHDQWLAQMIRPFETDQKVVGVLGNQIPRDDAPPFIERDIRAVFESFTKDDTIMYYNANFFNPKKTPWGVMTFFSDVNAAVRRSFAMRNPYDEVEYAEDQMMGKQIIEIGLTKAYNPKAAVLHSHRYPIHQYFFRLYDEAKGVKDVLGYSDPISIFAVLPESIKGWRHDHEFIQQKPWSFLRKLKWSVYSFIYQLSRRLAAIAVRIEYAIPLFIRKNLSLEHARKDTR